MIKVINIYEKLNILFYVQVVRVVQDEQFRFKDVEINELKSVRMDLDREFRDVRTVVDRVGVLVSKVILEVMVLLVFCML